MGYTDATIGCSLKQPKRIFYLIFSGMIFGFTRFITEQMYGTESNTVDELHLNHENDRFVFNLVRYDGTFPLIFFLGVGMNIL